MIEVIRPRINSVLIEPDTISARQVLVIKVHVEDVVTRFYPSITYCGDIFCGEDNVMGGSVPTPEPIAYRLPFTLGDNQGGGF